MTTVAPLRRIAALAAVVLGAAPSAAGAQQTDGDDWRHGGVCYEIFVRSFQDSDGDGIGDLQGLIDRLDYVNDGDPATETDLGARCIWLMPIHASMSYHGYDVVDYRHIDRRYGTNDDFRRLVDAAHRRGIRVLLDMVINHSSSEHPWFRDALTDPRSAYRDWYRWSDSRGEPNEWGGYNWHRSEFADEYYYGFFWGGMPDLNWETAAVREEMKDVATFWLRDMGADGFRLDAVRHLAEDGNRTANVPRTHDFLREYGQHIRRVAPGAFTIGEVFDSTDALRAYYPDQLDAYFAFEVANAILAAVRDGTGGALLEKVTDLQGVAPPTRWAPFLRNHDQTRTMTWLGGDVPRAKLAASLLLTLPGVPFVYYGEEIGMTGDKPDPRLRTPMHWRRAPAAGFTDGMPWEPLQPDSFTANVAVQDDDPASLLNHYRRLIHLRGRDRALGAGTLVPLATGRDDVVAFLRRDGDAATVVVANLSEATASGVRVASEDRVLPAGRHGARRLLGDGAAAPLTVGADGRIRGWTPVAEIPPLTAVVVGLERVAGR